MAKGNLALLQCQATVVGFLAAVVAILVDLWSDGSVQVNHAILMASASVITANLTSVCLSKLPYAFCCWSTFAVKLPNRKLIFCLLCICVQGAVMILVVIVSRKHHINPDNIATPIASSLGDVTTVAVLAYTSGFFYRLIGENFWWAPAGALVFMAVAPMTALYAHRNKYTNRVLSYGWLPIIFAMIISSAGGIILDKSIAVFKGIAPYQPVINGALE